MRLPSSKNVKDKIIIAFEESQFDISPPKKWAPPTSRASLEMLKSDIGVDANIVESRYDQLVQVADVGRPKLVPVLAALMALELSLYFLLRRSPALGNYAPRIDQLSITVVYVSAHVAFIWAVFPVLVTTSSTIAVFRHFGCMLWFIVLAAIASQLARLVGLPPYLVQATEFSMQIIFIPATALLVAETCATIIVNIRHAELGLLQNLLRLYGFLGNEGSLATLKGRRYVVTLLRSASLQVRKGLQINIKGDVSRSALVNQQLLGIAAMLNEYARWSALPLPTTRNDVQSRVKNLIFVHVRGEWGLAPIAPLNAPATKFQSLLRWGRVITIGGTPFATIAICEHWGFISQNSAYKGIAAIWFLIYLFRELDPGLKDALATLKDAAQLAAGKDK